MKQIFTTALIFLLAGVLKTQAQFVYPNDICSGAMPLPIGNTGQLSDSVFQRNAYADPASSAIPNCEGNTTLTRYDLWYSFVATDASIAVVLEYITGFGVYYQLFSGSCGSLSSLQCSPSGIISPDLTGLVPGQQYYLRTFYPNVINSLLRGFASNYKLSLLSKPTNDDCSGAALLPVNPANSSAYTVSRFSNNLSTSPVVATCASNTGWTNYRDVWYKFVATSTVHTVYMETPTANTRVAIYQGSLGSLTSVTLHQSASFLVSKAETLTDLVVGDTYYIRAGAVANVQFNLGISQGSPANDQCANADTVKMSSSFKCENSFMVNRLGATNSTATVPCPQSSDNDVWYIFQATSSDISVTIAGDNESSLRLGLLSGNCGSFTCLANSLSSSLTYSGLTVGNYYYLKAGGFYPERPATICIAPKISNDECSAAILLPVKPYNALRNTIGYNKNTTQSMPACGNPTTIADVWYRFTATDTACLITIDDEENGGADIQVFSGDCNILNSIYCKAISPLPGGATERTHRISGLMPGNNYYVRYYTSLSTGMLFTIDINSLPANDTCSAAINVHPQQGLTFETLKNNGILDASTSLPPCSTATITNDIWYKFTATQNSMAIISNRKSSATVQLGFEVYTGSCGGLTSVACIQQGTAAHKAQTLTNLVPGQTYFIRQYGNVTTNRFTIVEKPVNDEMAGAIKISLSPVTVQSSQSYYLHGASKRFGKICSNANYTIHHDVWFYFIASEASHAISTSAFNSFWEEQLAGYTYRIETFRGYAADSTALAAKAISCGAGSLNVNGLTAGDTVYVRIANTSAAGNTSIFSIKVNNSQNIDEPAGALVMDEINDYQYLLNTTGATQSLPASGCIMADFPDDDIWLKFTASATAKRIIAGYESRDITLQLFAGTPGNLTALQCSNNIMVLPAGLTNGTVYFVRAYSKANAAPATFRIGLYGEDDPLANSCVNGAVLGPNLVANPRCESEYKYLLPKNDDGAIIAGRKIAEGWWSGTYPTADTWNADYPVGEYGNTPGSSGSSREKIPRSGKGMLGILSTFQGGEWAEYVTGKLTQPLTVGKTYLISFYMSMDKKELAKNCFNIGAYLSSDSLLSIRNNSLEITPHIANPSDKPVTEENTWVKICGTVYADKPFSFITIGNFGSHQIYSSSFRTYFFIDDVVVAETTPQVLPLRLLEFNGRMNAQQQSELQWVTGSETSTKHFEVQWRTDTKPFTAIGTVQAAGNSTTDKHYNFLHPNPEAGNNYYRLKMVDIDGRFTFSPMVKTVLSLKNNRLSVHPNPVTSALNVVALLEKDEMVAFRIVGADGRTMATKKLMLQKGSTSFSWDMSTLAAGHYFLVSTSTALQPVHILKQ